jgi:hypothetical protein
MLERNTRMPHSLNQSTNFSGEGRTGTLLFARVQEPLACPLTHQKVQLLLATTANGPFGHRPDVDWRSGAGLAVTVTPIAVLLHVPCARLHDGPEHVDSHQGHMVLLDDDGVARLRAALLEPLQLAA